MNEDLRDEITLLEQKCEERRKKFLRRSRFFKILNILFCLIVSISGGTIIFLTLEVDYTDGKNILIALGILVSGIPVIDQIAGLQRKTQLYYHTSKIFDGMQRYLHFVRINPGKDNNQQILFRVGGMVDSLDYLVFEHKLGDTTDTQLGISKILQKYDCYYDSGTLICDGIV